MQDMVVNNDIELYEMDLKVDERLFFGDIFSTDGMSRFFLIINNA